MWIIGGIRLFTAHSRLYTRKGVMKMEKDLTQGKPMSIMWRFALPLFLSVVFQQLYNIADSVIAGKFINVDALAAVGASYPITMIFLAIGTGAGAGASVIVSQLFGSKDNRRMLSAISTSLLGIAALGAVLTILGAIFCNDLMRLLDTPSNVFTDASLYLCVYIWGLLFLFIYNTCNGIFTSLGDSKTPLYFLICSSVGNIILDFVFVYYLKMGVAGVAWATFICQGVASVLALFTLLRRMKRLSNGEPFQYFSLPMLGRISRIAGPSMLQQSFVSVGNLFVQRLVNSFGSAVMAAYSSAMKLNMFALTCFFTVANALSAFAAQNLGAGQVQRVKEGFKAASVLIVALTVPFLVVYTFFPDFAMKLFLSEADDIAAVLREGASFLQITSPFFVVIVFKFLADSVLKSAGIMGEFMIATFSDLVLRVAFAYIMALAFGMGSTGIWWGWPIGWILGTVVSLAFYFHGKWKNPVLVRAEAENAS